MHIERRQHIYLRLGILSEFDILSLTSHIQHSLIPIYFLLRNSPESPCSVHRALAGRTLPRLFPGPNKLRGLVPLIHKMRTETNTLRFADRQRSTHLPPKYKLQ